MLNAPLFLGTGAGRAVGARAARALSLAAVVAVASGGCATKGDLRDVRAELQALAAQQREAVDELAQLNLAVQDTLRGQSDALVESRGEIIRRLRMIEEELRTLQELTGQNQRSLTILRDLIEAQRTVAANPMRTDTEPGQQFEPALLPEPPRAGGAEEMYNAAVTQFNRGSTNTARRAFQQFLQEYPNDPLAPDAHFYLADILVQENRLEEAIQAFLRIPELFPTAEKVPEALYRVGVLYIELEDLDDARVYLERVVNSYPESGAAVLAKERLAEIG